MRRPNISSAGFSAASISSLDEDDSDVLEEEHLEEAQSAAASSITSECPMCWEVYENRDQWLAPADSDDGGEWARGGGGGWTSAPASYMY